MESDNMWGVISLIGLMVLLQGVFNGVEAALLLAQKSRLQQWKEERRRGAAEAVLMREAPERFLTTLQIAATFAGVCAAVLAGVMAVQSLTPWLVERWSFPTDAFWVHIVSLALTIGMLTYVGLILGQLVPKAIALQHAEQVLCRAAPPLIFLTRMNGVVRAALTVSLTVILWLLGQRRPPESASVTAITEEAVTTMVREGAERGIFEEVEHELIEGVFEFTDTAVREIMVPRVRIQALEVTTPPQEVIRRVGEMGHSRVPVYSGDLDHVVGVLYYKDLLRAMSEGEAWNLHSLLHPPLFVPETVQISRLLRMLQQQRLNMAMVVDEHGGVAGLVTIEDLLEELVGEISDEREPEPDAQIVQLPDGALVVQGNVPLWELRERLALPVQESSDYQTLAGFLLARLERIPKGGESVAEQGYIFTVVDMEGPRIARIKVDRRPAEESEPGSAGPPYEGVEQQERTYGEA
jgi:putative hemolysin